MSFLSHRLAATKADTALHQALPRIRWHVGEVYRHAVFIRGAPSRGAEDGAAHLVLARDQVGGQPCGISVAGVTDFRRLGIAPGMTVSIADDALGIPAARCTVDLRHARLWSALLPGAAKMRSEASRRVWFHEAKVAASLAAPDAGFGPLLNEPVSVRERWVAVAQPRIEELGRAFAASDMMATVAAARALVGVGVGLTPSGDDVLVGFLAALHALSPHAAIRLGADLSEGLTGRTTQVSELYLRAACRGEFSEAVQRFLVALFADSPDDVVGAVAWVLDHGASSGADTLVGLFLAMTANCTARNHGLEPGA